MLLNTFLYVLYCICDRCVDESLNCFRYSLCTVCDDLWRALVIQGSLITFLEIFYYFKVVHMCNTAILCMLWEYPVFFKVTLECFSVADLEPTASI